MAEQTFVDKLKGNLFLVFLASMGLILLIRLVFLLLESGGTSEPLAEPQQATITPVTTAESPEVRKVGQMARRWNAFDQSEFYRLGQSSMFDPNLVKNSDALVAEANNLVSQALAQQRAGNEAEALRLAKAALDKRPGHPMARQIVTSLEQPTTGTTQRLETSAEATPASEAPGMAPVPGAPPAAPEAAVPPAS